MINFLSVGAELLAKYTQLTERDCTGAIPVSFAAAGPSTATMTALLEMVCPDSVTTDCDDTFVTRVLR